MCNQPTDFTITIGEATIKGVKHTVIELAPQSELDMGTFQRFQDTVMGWFKRGSQNIILDLTGVVYMDGLGLGSLVRIRRQINEANGTLTLWICDQSIIKLIEVTALRPLFKIYRTKEDMEKSS